MKLLKIILKNKDIVSSFKDNPKVGTAGLCKKYTRLSFVCYLREKLIQCEDTDIDERFLLNQVMVKYHNKIILFFYMYFIPSIFFTHII